MDIIKKIKPLKATYENLSNKHKLGISLIILGLLLSLNPHRAIADAGFGSSSLLFNLGDHESYLKEKLEKTAKALRYKDQEERLRKELNRKRILAQRLERYLKERNSPLSAHSDLLVKMDNWKKIIAIANAESSLCKKYPATTANCWGVGGANLWDFGTNLNDGIVGMNRFLQHYPKKSKVKYAQMSFEQMNGLYKQPAKNHWVINNKVVFQELEDLEQGF